MIKKTLGRIIYWLSWPLVWLVVRNTRRSRILLVCGKDILLVKNALSRDDKWTLPGGGAKGSETDKVCASRELKEELGIIIDPVNLREMGEYTHKSHGYSYIATLFVASCDKGRKIKKSHEISELAWFPIKKLPANRKPLVDEVILRIKQG